MATLHTPAELSTRISIFNLDPVEQSKLWLQQGPVAANATLIGVLRAALLFGGTVVVDRNQVLEGIFFIAMSPDRLAWHLGLEPGAKLPLEVQLLGKHEDAEIAPGPWHLSDGRRRWGTQAERLVADIEGNYAAVKDDKHRVSSPLIALTGGMYELAAGVTQPESYSSSATRPTEAWEEADHLVLPQGVWEEQDLDVAKEVRKNGRLAWVDAMKSGRVEVRSGNKLGPNPLGPELSQEPPPNPGGLAVVDELATALITLEYVDQAARDATAPCRADHWGTSELCERAHVTNRSLVARWLDGEHLEQLQPPALPQHLRGREFANHRSAALGWWTLAYYRAISERDGLRLLTIFNALSAPAAPDDNVGASTAATATGAESSQAVEIAWGLRRPKRHAFAQILARLRPLKKTATASTLPIGGDVVDRLADFTPSQYSRLKAFEAVQSNHLLEDPGRRSLFDLVMAIDEVVGDTSSRRRRMRGTAFRASAAMAVALGLVLYENGFIEVSGAVWPVAAVIAAGLLAAPWSDIGALRRMSGSQLQSTLRFQHDDD